ncbi:MAG: cation transporter [Magnetococcales bacterium]|nr:cation transporter [Magnetococcales bacterium]
MHISIFESTIHVTMPIKGLKCKSCKNKLEKALRVIPMVTKAVVDLTASTVTVMGNASPEEIACVIQCAGFRAPIILSRP